MPTPRSSSDCRLPPHLVVTARGSTEPPHGSQLLTPLARDSSRAYPGEANVVNLRYPAALEYVDPSYPATIELGDSPVQGTRNLIHLLNDRTDVGKRDRLFSSDGPRARGSSSTPWSKMSAVLLAGPHWRHGRLSRSPQSRCSGFRRSPQADRSTSVSSVPASAESYRADPDRWTDRQSACATTAPVMTLRLRYTHPRRSRATGRTSTNGMLAAALDTGLLAGRGIAPL